MVSSSAQTRLPAKRSIVNDPLRLSHNECTRTHDARIRINLIWVYYCYRNSFYTFSQKNVYKHCKKNNNQQILSFYRNNTAKIKLHLCVCHAYACIHCERGFTMEITCTLPFYAHSNRPICRFERSKFSHCESLLK